MYSWCSCLCLLHPGSHSRYPLLLQVCWSLNLFSPSFFSCVPPGWAFICLFFLFYVLPWVHYCICALHMTPKIIYNFPNQSLLDTHLYKAYHIYPATCQTVSSGCPTEISAKGQRNPTPFSKQLFYGFALTFSIFLSKVANPVRKWRLHISMSPFSSSVTLLLSLSSASGSFKFYPLF